MKNFYLSMIALVSCVSVLLAATAYVTPTGDLSTNPLDVVSVYLADNVVQTADTIATGNYVVYGPISMAGSKNSPMFSGFESICQDIAGTTPVAAIAYQMGNSIKSADLASGLWTTYDTLEANGSAVTVSLSGRVAKYIWFRIHNYDGTSDYLTKPIYINFKRNLVFEQNRN